MQSTHTLRWVQRPSTKCYIHLVADCQSFGTHFTHKFQLSHTYSNRQNILVASSVWHHILLIIMCPDWPMVHVTGDPVPVGLSWGDQENTQHFLTRRSWVKDNTWVKPANRPHSLAPAYIHTRLYSPTSKHTWFNGTLVRRRSSQTYLTDNKWA